MLKEREPEQKGIGEGMEREACLRRGVSQVLRMGKAQGDTLKNTRAMLTAKEGAGTVSRGGVLDNLEWSLTLTRRILDVVHEMEQTLGGWHG